jgi:nitronate monooxygenase
VLQEYRPAVVSFHFGLPAPDHLATIRAWGGKVLACATTLDEALYLDAQSVDILVVQGLEAGGHRGHFLRDDLDGQLTSAELAAAVLPQVQVPVVVAGGIHCADQVAQYLAMGAAGVQVGTAFLRCPEATTSDVHRKALRAGSQSGTALTNLFSGRLARGLVNRLMRERGPLAQQLPDFPLASAALVSLRSAAESLGSGDFSPLWAGENYHFGEDISAEQVVAVLMDVPGARS